MYPFIGLKDLLPRRKDEFFLLYRVDDVALFTGRLPEGKARLRSSGVGNPCPRAVYYSIVEPTIFERETLNIFDTGTALEEVILKEVARSGYRVMANAGDEVGLLIHRPGGFISGHIDALVSKDGEEWYICDAKTMNKTRFENFKVKGLSETPSYDEQLALYSYAYRKLFKNVSSKRMLACMNKNNSQVHLYEDEGREPNWERIDHILDCLNTSTVPEAVKGNCFFCNYKHHCKGEF